MNDFVTPLLQICKAIYSIGMSCSTMTNDIANLMNLLNGYIIQQQLDLP